MGAHASRGRTGIPWGRAIAPVAKGRTSKADGIDGAQEGRITVLEFLAANGYLIDENESESVGWAITDFLNDSPAGRLTTTCWSQLLLRLLDGGVLRYGNT
jgi:hypothetical protein